MKTISRILCGLSILAGWTSCNPAKEVTVEGLIIEPSRIEMKKGETARLKVVVTPAEAAGQPVSWTSSDTRTASVDEAGTVTAVGTGDALIQAVCGTRTASCLVSVLPVGVDEIVLEQTDIEMIKGETLWLKAKVLPEDAAYDRIRWETSDKYTVQVEQDGKVTALKAGTATITARAGDAEAVCRITVKGKPVESITLNHESVTLESGSSLTLIAEILPEDADVSDKEWTSSNPQIVSVEANGNITAIAEGNAVITVTAGGCSADCQVSVIPRTSEIQVGDYYYEDGSTSPALIAEKKVIGIVFWTGDPTAQDPTLKREHPDCTHGLAVSIEGHFTAPWQSGANQFNESVSRWIAENAGEYEDITTATDGSEPDNMNRIIGYNNTRALEAFNQAEENKEWPVEAIQKVQDFRQSSPAPSSSSDWYLPSAKELSLLCTGTYDGNIWTINEPMTATRNLMDSKMEQITGAVKLGDDVCWTSNEFMTSYAFIVGMGDGMVSYSATDNTQLKVRCILAF